MSDMAEEYKAETDEGMKKDVEETRQTSKEQRDEAIRKRRDEREKLEERIWRQIGLPPVALHKKFVAKFVTTNKKR